ncbi:MAG: 3-isopropylmalate dehydrogenase [bacterium]
MVKSSQRTYTIAVLPGDGIGREVVAEAVKILTRLGKLYRHTFILEEGLIGGAALTARGVPLPDETLALCRHADAVLLGAVGDPNYDGNPPELKPEKALLGLRKELGLYANLRPAKPYTVLLSSSTIKEEVLRDVDLLVVRELTGGLYFGEPRGFKKIAEELYGFNTMVYSESEIERIASVAFEAAAVRRKKVCSVDKANVLETSQLWRNVVSRVGLRFPEIELSHMYVDNCSMQLIRNPRQFDVILTENMFGDILSDEASMLTGSLGLLPSASLGGRIGMYEPVHGSAPDIAQQNKANPIATIASVALMLRYSLGMEQEALVLERAIEDVLSNGFRTADLYSNTGTLVGTSAMGDAIGESLQKSI